MLTSEQAAQFLKDHRIPERTVKDLRRFSKPYQQLGKLILRNRYEDHKQSDQEIYRAAFGDAADTNPWRSEEGNQLAELLFGAPKAHYLPGIWERCAHLPYQTGYSRRPFRRPVDASLVKRRCERLNSLNNSATSGFGQLDVMETARYSGYAQWSSPPLALFFAEALDDPATAPTLRTLLADIIQGEDEIGKVSRGIIKGLLLTEDPQNWRLVEQLLLAAQRQEGLRQTILESLDETSIGALRHFIGVILEHDLARFSSVVRAVDTWFGFGWEAPKKATIKRVLELALGFLQRPETTVAALKGKDNLALFIALWAQGLENVNVAVASATEVLFEGDRPQKLTALYFVHQTERSETRIADWVATHLGQDPELDYWTLRCFPASKQLSDELVDQLIAYGASAPKAGQVYSGTIFNWLNIKLEPEFWYRQVLHYGTKQHLIQLSEGLSKLPITIRENLLRKIFPDHYSYSLAYGVFNAKTATTVAAEAWKRELIRRAASDRSEIVMATGVRFLGALKLEEADKAVILKLLSRKGKALRTALIKVILGQPGEILKALVSELLSTKKEEQRLAGLEILTILDQAGKLTSFALAQLALYQQRGSFSKNEMVLLQKFAAPEENDISYANGFGAIDHERLAPLITPRLRFKVNEQQGLSSRLSSAAKSLIQPIVGNYQLLYPELIDEAKTVRALNELIELYLANGKHEYTIWTSADYSEITLVENIFGFNNPAAFVVDDREKLKYLPLAEVWQDWYDRSQLNDFELSLAIHALKDHDFQHKGHPFYAFSRQYIPALAGLKLPEEEWERQNLQRRISNILDYFYQAVVDHDTMYAFQIDLFEDLLARLPQKLRKPIKYKNSYGWNAQAVWTEEVSNMVPGRPMNLLPEQLVDKDLDTVQRAWNLENYLLAHRLVAPAIANSAQQVAKIPPKERYISTPSIWCTLYLHQQGRLTDDDLRLQALVNDQLLGLLNGNRQSLRWVKEEYVTVPEGLIDTLKANLLDLELKRGDLVTDATDYVHRLQPIEGMHYLFRTLERLGKENLHRGYSYGEASRKVSFSGILKKSIPAATDTLEAFKSQAKSLKLPTKRWFEVAMYAPQWAPWVAEFLGIKELELAIWWFHAHASDYISGQKEKIVAQFSPIDKADFAQGAIDIDWFYAAYQAVGKKNWKLLHDAAKYISNGNGHRQVKTYSAVMLGEVKITETLKKIKEKRDKVYVRALGLVPLSPRRPAKDLLERYQLLQEFIRESKQFGAQRQESEKTAATIGLDNLARNAGYDDVTRFSWIMEAEATQAIMNQSLVILDEVSVQLVIDQDGKADLKVAKAGKAQKSIPTKIRKHKDIQTLQEHKKILRRQFSRTRVSLENAMLAGTTFSPVDIDRINQHPVVKTMLAKLVLLVPETGASGCWADGNLRGVDGKTHQLKADTELVIAHPAHLYQAVEWDLYQRLAFEQQLVQPFKQIFRELYLMTKDERETKHESLRYQGHQIQPKKAAALLRTRGWTVSDTEGLQKVYHKRDIIATMYAMADWYAPAEVEAPAIEGVIFRNRDGNQLNLESLDPVLFSEVMRDIDLVVSVAHVGGVDPEASHSTLEMRGALARESARLFKAENVEVKDRHIIVSGELGNYSIHLGSGLVSKGGRQLNLLAVHSQHRGRIFLPFLDDDPKSAEIIAKMKLLAEDGKIKDPTVLGQIMG